jgi:hypothetical protein
MPPITNKVLLSVCQSGTPYNHIYPSELLRVYKNPEGISFPTGVSVNTGNWFHIVHIFEVIIFLKN